MLELSEMTNEVAGAKIGADALRSLKHLWVPRLRYPAALQPTLNRARVFVPASPCARVHPTKLVDDVGGLGNVACFDHEQASYVTRVYASTVERVYVPCQALSMAESVTIKLKELRERAQLSMHALALAIGFRTASSYQRYEDPALFKKNELPLHIIRKLLDVLPGKGIPPITREEIMMLSGLNDLSAPQLESIDNQDWILCVGEAAVGVWKERAEWASDQNEPLAIATRDRRYPSARRRALLIKDDSIDELYSPGSYVIFVPFSEVGRAPKATEKVIVHRRRHGLVEVSVRVVSVDPAGKIWLNAKSSNPAHYAIPAHSQSDDGTTIEVVGLVVGSQTIE